MSNLNTWPTVIYLQHSEDDYPVPVFKDETDHITWAEKPVFNSDIEYVRADLAAAAPDLLAALIAAEKKLLELEHMVGGGDDEISLESEILTAQAAIYKATGGQP